MLLSETAINPGLNSTICKTGPLAPNVPKISYSWTCSLILMSLKEKSSPPVTRKPLYFPL